MAKRFTATEKWDKEWFTKLSLKHKCLWFYLLDKCDTAGIWEVNFSLASHCLGTKITEVDINVFGEKLVRVAIDKYIIFSFIKFQYGTLSEDCKPHIPIIKRLKQFQIYERVLKGYVYPLERVMDKEQEKDKEKEMDKEGVKGEQKSANEIFRKFAHLSISLDEIDSLLKLGYEMPVIVSTIDSIENYAKNKNYKSLYLTTKKWLEKDNLKQNGKPKTIPGTRITAETLARINALDTNIDKL